MEIKPWERDLSLLSLNVEAHMPYRWAIGKDGSIFFHQIREWEVLLGIKCPKCGKVYVPPKMVCGPCFQKMDQLVELGREGVIRAVTLVNYPFIDPDTGSKRPVPYVYGYIQLDGADNLFSHIVQAKSGRPVKVGERVRAVFREEKKGNIQDIAYFETL